MNLAFVVYSHYSRDARVRRYAECLARKGFKVDVVCLDEHYTPKENNITLIKYPIPRRRFGRLWYIFEYLLFFIYSFLKLTLNHLSQRYQILHINNMPDTLVFTALIPKLFGAKIILDMHDPMPELYMSKYHASENSFMVKWLKWLENMSFDFADQILTANEEFKRMFLARNPQFADKITVILNCPDPRIFSIKAGPLKFKRPGLFSLFYMGTVEERFGLDIVVEAIPAIVRRIPNLRFIIIPKLEEEGEYYNNFKLQISNFKLENYIKIMKPHPLEKIAVKLKEADAGVVLAKNGIFTESIFPVKLLEFVQMNIPVIATNTKILSRYFTDKQIFFLEKNTPEEFLKAVLMIYKNRDLRKRLTENAKEYLKKYNWGTEEKIYLQIINQLKKF